MSNELKPTNDNVENVVSILLAALERNLKAFRDMYNAYEDGADFEDIYMNAEYWPLTQTRMAINEGEKFMRGASLLDMYKENQED